MCCVLVDSWSHLGEAVTAVTQTKNGHFPPRILPPMAPAVFFNINRQQKTSLVLVKHILQCVCGCWQSPAVFLSMRRHSLKPSFLLREVSVTESNPPSPSSLDLTSTIRQYKKKKRWCDDWHGNWNRKRARERAKVHVGGGWLCWALHYNFISPLSVPVSRRMQHETQLLQHNQGLTGRINLHHYASSWAHVFFCSLRWKVWVLALGGGAIFMKISNTFWPLTHNFLITPND